MADKTEVHLIFTGIVGFVPTARGLTVVVQDARGSDHEAHNGDHYPHIPHVVIEEGAYSKSPGLYELKPDNGLRGFLLEQYAVTILNTIQEATLSEAANFRQFVLVLERGCPANGAGCGGILRHVLGGVVPDGKDSSGRQTKVAVAARMPLPHGRVESTYVDPYDLWQFQGLSGKPMRLAEEVCHRFEIDGKILRLSFAKNAGGDSGLLEVKVPDGKKTIEVRIGNLPENLVFQRYRGLQPIEPDEHVKLYYDLSALPPSSRRALVPSKGSALANPPQTAHTHRLTPRPDPHWMVRGPNCPPALWS